MSGATNKMDSATSTAAIAHDRIQIKKKPGRKPALTVISTNDTTNVVTPLMIVANLISRAVGRGIVLVYVLNVRR